MKSNRRNFLKLSGLTGVMLAGGSFVKASVAESSLIRPQIQKDRGEFNMCGYAAPKLEKVRIGFIGLGNRGPGAVMRNSKIDGVEIKALCDLRPEKANGAKQKLLEATKAFNPASRKKPIRIGGA